MDEHVQQRDVAVAAVRVDYCGGNNNSFSSPVATVS